MTTAAELVELLGLVEHPEGGWYRRTWTAPERGADGRALGSSVLYLLDASGSSHWHRIDATELWHVVGGDPLELARWDGDGPVDRVVLGPRPGAHEHPQVVVDAGVWQSARTTGAWSLATCVVVPEFRFDGFELAPPGWAPPR